MTLKSKKRKPEAMKPDGKLVRTFILRFLAIIGGLILVTFIPGWDGFVHWYMTSLGVMVNALLHLLGEPTRLAGENVFSDAFNLKLAPHCGALHVLQFFGATVLAFPASATQRIVGVLAGFSCIVLLNLLRLVTVYLAGAHWPTRVQALHEELWPVLLIMGTVILCATWVGWVGGRRAR